MKAEREEMAQGTERKRQSLIRRELEWMQRGARARSTKQKARIERFENLTGQRGLDGGGNVEMQVSFSRLGRKVIEIENVSKSYPCGEIIRGFSYVLLRDDRIGIIGPNGIGKSTLMKIAAGRLFADSGRVAIGETVKIGYFSQENEDMDEGLRVIEYIREQAEFITTDDGVKSASQMLERFLFAPSVQWTPISKLSGGEKRRLYLLRILMSAPNVLMLDEPTNDLDIQTLTILEDYLDEFPGAVMVVSHDRYFLDRVVDSIFSFEGEGEIRQYAGNYSDYLQFVQQRESLLEESKSGARAGTGSGTGTGTSGTFAGDKAESGKQKPMKFSYNEQREFDQIDGRIADLEAAIQQIDHQMHESASDFAKLQQLTDEKAQLEHQLDQAIERWTYLNELYEEIERNKRGE
jgi:ATP-binding cassette subfamily F protein uup